MLTARTHAPAGPHQFALSGIFIAALVLLFLPVHPADNRATEGDLKTLRGRIEAIRKNIQADTERRDSLAGALQAADMSIQAAREQSAEIRKQRQASERKLAELARERAITEQQVAAQREALSREIRLAYMNGGEEQLKLLLNQQDPNQLGRMLAYYGYFGRARAARIAAINERLEHLQALSDSIAAETQRLRDIESRQQTQLKQLAQARGRRAQTLAAMQASLRTRADQLAGMQRQAAALERLLEELRSVADDFPVSSDQPFAKLQGKLPWPVKGKLRARFGELRAGGPLKWQGVLIGADSGAQVRAPFHGRVEYADWLSGMGLLVIVNHGGGYRSLYGHNEQLYRKVGDTVAPGDALGALGESSGQDRVELYLEIRKGTQPQDPQRWLRKQ